MIPLNQWLDRLVQRLCDWLNDFFSGHHGLAMVGNGLAGLDGMPPLPLDRRLGPPRVQMSKPTFQDGDKWPTGEGGWGPWGIFGGKDEHDCDYWAYCHMGGEPCVNCKGRNAVKSGDPRSPGGCPPGALLGAFWMGCCKDPVENKVKMILWYDCCSPPGVYLGKCDPNAGPNGCRNWQQAKNWCYLANNAYKYYCTVALWDPNSHDDLCEKK
jgi:hypothetical protein